MTKFDGAKSATNPIFKRGCAIAALGATVIAAGCSAEVTRFDQPAFGLTDSNPNSQVEPVSARQSGLNYSDSGPATGTIPVREPVRTAALPDVSDSRDYVQPARYEPAIREPEPTYEREPADYRDETRGEIEVQRGDTLYGLSRTHGVSINALMRVNGLNNSNLRPGQILKLPAGASNTSSATASPIKRVTRPSPTREPVGAASTNWGATYIVERGDSLYKIARRYNVKVSELQTNNGITNPRLVRPGTILKVPGSEGLAQTAASNPTTDPRPRLIQTDTEPVANTFGRNTNQRVAILNAKPVTGTTAPRVVQQVAVTPPKIEVPDGATKLRWPVTGKVISQFGRRADGTHNDGINLEVPEGTAVKAADAGVVAYSGSELRGYGKLILVRHENGWVTAYAHNQDVNVKRGDKVARGQVIAKAGKTGQVDRPQVHFELRRDAKPVDPLPYLEQL